MYNTYMYTSENTCYMKPRGHKPCEEGVGFFETFSIEHSSLLLVVLFYRGTKTIGMGGKKIESEGVPLHSL